MSRIAYPLAKIRAIAFDIDGVLSPSTVSLDPEGIPRRMVNVKDGYAMQLAVKLGLKMCIITGAVAPGIAERYHGLGIKDVFMGSSHKLPILQGWIQQQELQPEDVAFVGDDIPDIPAMQHVGLSVAPCDAADDVLDMALYISPVAGGRGVARDLIEQVLRAQDLWMQDTQAFGW